ncbi:unnamed protein product [Lasius platythorax]|uniref:Uncharacterized protein n=1 Tax=Lasius platythorax TaxID=488582 RepID=A0AAV2NH34_9HYME
MTESKWMCDTKWTDTWPPSESAPCGCFRGGAASVPGIRVVSRKLGYTSGQLVMRGMSQLRPTFDQLPPSVILSGVRSQRLSAVYPTIDSPRRPSRRKIGTGTQHIEVYFATMYIVKRT